MGTQHLTIKELTDAVGGGVTPRMVRHYHLLGLLPTPVRSQANYRLYAQADVQRLRRIVALKQQGFQLSHIRQLLEIEPQGATSAALTTQLQQQYRSVMQQLGRLRHTAAALEGFLGRDRSCQITQAEALAQLKLLQAESCDGIGELQHFWDSLDATAHDHPEEFEESLEQLLPDLSGKSEIEIGLLSQLVLACGDVSLVPFVRLSKGAIAAARNALKTECQIIGDVPAVVAALDHTRLAHLGCKVETLIDDPHITSAAEAEQKFWQHKRWKERLQQVEDGCVLLVGYAPSVLFSICTAIERGEIKPAFVIGMPVGFSHAPVAKRQLALSNVPHVTIAGTVGGGLLAAVTLNSLVESLLEKPHCHCYLQAEI